ncbi:hypothetical protein EXIGLDRAFT_725094 [Exidia glandulosa HHB12029]|uniref:Uncharacterized protein n=1 Tax=Exidia glandulosa HHB12029 TaxID=1314781 RepID=A0A165E710_EXIGL|nr:hypothetical protein EXIGLDRAFT_725094 [Exidia glandulosa HHB12029]
MVPRWLIILAAERLGYCVFFESRTEPACVWARFAILMSDGYAERWARIRSHPLWEW